MKKSFLVFMNVALLTALAGCQTNSSPEEVELAEEIEEETATDTPVIESSEPREWEFQHTVSADSYTITVLHNSNAVGTIDKEVPADGWVPYVFETTDNDVFIAIDPTGLGGYILYSYAFDLYRYNPNSGELTEVPVDNVYDVSSDGKLVAYHAEFEDSSGSTLGIAVYDLTENKIVSRWTAPDEFEQFGDARFSPDNKNLAFQATDIDDENGLIEETALFYGPSIDGDYDEVARQEGLYAVSWETNEILKNTL